MSGKKGRKIERSQAIKFGLGSRDFVLVMILQGLVWLVEIVVISAFETVSACDS
jgi:hypothetical protein